MFLLIGIESEAESNTPRDNGEWVEWVPRDELGQSATEAAKKLLTAQGFKTSQVPLSAVTDAIEATASGGGRIDAIVLPAPLRLSPAHRHPPSHAVARKIRALDGDLTFRGGVRARRVPIVARGFLFGPGTSFTEYYSAPEVRNDNVRPYVSQAEFPEVVVSAIREWRQDLVNELDYIGYTVTIDDAGSFVVSHALRRKRQESEILAAESTPGALRAAQYLILADDFIESLGRYDELKFLLANYESIAKREGIKPETVFQRFFETNPELIQRDAFSAVFAKPMLRRPEAPGRFYQPDFVMKPRVGASVGTNWEVFDLKLPDDPLLTSGSFHPAFSGKLTRAVQQLRNYRHYFSRHDTKDELVARFGYQPVQPRLAVLIGRRDRAGGIEHAQGSAALDINIITYDDIVELEESRLVLQGHFAALFNDQ